MNAQSVALLSDEGFPALRISTGCVPRFFSYPRIREHALLGDRTGNNGSAQPRRNGIGPESLTQLDGPNERALPHHDMRRTIQSGGVVSTF